MPCSSASTSSCDRICWFIRRSLDDEVGEVHARCTRRRVFVRHLALLRGFRGRRLVAERARGSRSTSAASCSLPSRSTSCCELLCASTIRMLLRIAGMYALMRSVALASSQLQRDADLRVALGFAVGQVDGEGVERRRRSARLFGIALAPAAPARRARRRLRLRRRPLRRRAASSAARPRRRRRRRAAARPSATMMTASSCLPLAARRAAARRRRGGADMRSPCVMQDASEACGLRAQGRIGLSRLGCRSIMSRAAACASCDTATQGTKALSAGSAQRIGLALRPG